MTSSWNYLAANRSTTVKLIANIVLPVNKHERSDFSSFALPLTCLLIRKSIRMYKTPIIHHVAETRRYNSPKNSIANVYLLTKCPNECDYFRRIWSRIEEESNLRNLTAIAIAGAKIFPLRKIYDPISVKRSKSNNCLYFLNRKPIDKNHNSLGGKTSRCLLSDWTDRHLISINPALSFRPSGTGKPLVPTRNLKKVHLNVLARSSPANNNVHW